MARLHEGEVDRSGAKASISAAYDHHVRCGLRRIKHVDVVEDGGGIVQDARIEGPALLGLMHNSPNPRSCQHACQIFWRSTCMCSEMVTSGDVCKQTMSTGLALKEASYARGKVGNSIETIYGRLPGAF